MPIEDTPDQTGSAGDTPTSPVRIQLPEHPVWQMDLSAPAKEEYEDEEGNLTSTVHFTINRAAFDAVAAYELARREFPNATHISTPRLIREATPTRTYRMTEEQAETDTVEDFPEILDHPPIITQDFSGATVVEEPAEMCLICRQKGSVGFPCLHPDAHIPLATSYQDANGEPYEDEPDENDAIETVTGPIRIVRDIRSAPSVELRRLSSGLRSSGTTGNSDFAQGPLGDETYPLWLVHIRPLNNELPRTVVRVHAESDAHAEQIAETALPGWIANGADRIPAKAEPVYPPGEMPASREAGVALLERAIERCSSVLTEWRHHYAYTAPELIPDAEKQGLLNAQMVWNLLGAYCTELKEQGMAGVLWHLDTDRAIFDLARTVLREVEFRG